MIDLMRLDAEKEKVAIKSRKTLAFIKHKVS